MANEKINNLTGVQKNNVKSVEYWQKVMLGMIKIDEGNYVFTKLGVAKDLPLHQGTTTYSMRRYNPLPISHDGNLTALTEGVAPESLKIEAQKVQATVNQYGNWIELTDVVDDVHMDNIKKEYIPELARIAKEQKERVVIKSFTDASEYFAGKKTAKNQITATDILKLADCRFVALTMKNYHRSGHTKFGGKPVFVVHPNVMQDLLDDSDLLNKILVPGNENSPMKNGTLESYKAYGLYFIESLMCPIEAKAGASNTNVYTSIALGKDPYVVLTFGNLQWKQTDFNATKDDPLGQRATFGYKHWVGAKVIDPMAVHRMYSASKYDIVANFTTDTNGKTASQA